MFINALCHCTGKLFISISSCNVSSKLRWTRTRGISCGGLSQQVAYVLEVSRLCGVREYCSCSYWKALWKVTERRATKTLPCFYLFITPYRILKHNRVEIACCLPSTSCSIFGQMKITENVVFKEQLYNPISVQYK